MKFRSDPASCQPDMTPMIDVTFQLVIFFMLTMNFSSDDQSERIRLPSSELAKPVEVPWTSPITLQLTDQESVIAGGDEVKMSGLRTVLQREKDALIYQHKSAAKATIIIRADHRAKTGLVQMMIATCQKVGFEKFVLRAREEAVVRSN